MWSTQRQCFIRIHGNNSEHFSTKICSDPRVVDGTNWRSLNSELYIPSLLVSLDGMATLNVKCFHFGWLATCACLPRTFNSTIRNMGSADCQFVSFTIPFWCDRHQIVVSWVEIELKNKTIMVTGRSMYDIRRPIVPCVCAPVLLHLQYYLYDLFNLLQIDGPFSFIDSVDVELCSGCSTGYNSCRGDSGNLSASTRRHSGYIALVTMLGLTFTCGLILVIFSCKWVDRV